ncbi:hypothetical protein [Chondromyces crocatus]|uniref:Uncharacterized protein n=1 Tax=Chondromyces crocatus TaxID=52 RepID=A0A0K1EH57_CHOCO|nr:hypothetical protein [Chondromyces crocatus]AKT40196.1 uncharacterized protein CMC5_043490 [Chondromyces crocatus]
MAWGGFGRGGGKYTGLIQALLLTAVGLAFLPVHFKGVRPSILFLVPGVFGVLFNAWSLRRGALGQLDR